MPYERLVDENDNITQDFKQIAKESFACIFNCLSKNNFIRWVQLKRFSKDVENLILDWMTEEEKEKYQTWDGFANSSENKIKIRRPETVSETSIHEVYHILSNSRFCTYIDEGLTEYLKGMSSKEGAKTYRENVQVVNFMHEMIGDSFIKAYLMGKKQQFDEKFADLICLDPSLKQKSQFDISYFYSVLNDRHKALYPTDGVKKEDNAQELDRTKKIVKDMMCNIVYGKVHKMAQNFEFYKDGKMDFNYAHAVIHEYIKKMPSDFSIDLETQYKLEVAMLEDVFENSHLGIEEDITKKEEQKSKIISSIARSSVNSQGRKTYVYVNSNPANIIGGEDVALKLFEQRFKNAKDIDVSGFVDSIVNIAQKTNMTVRQMNAVISQYAIKLFGDTADVKEIDDLIKANMDKCKTLSRIQGQREQNTIESYYRKVGERAYIEKRDNQFYYVRLEDDGSIIDTEFKYVSANDGVKIERINSNQMQEAKKGKSYYRIDDDSLGTIIIGMEQNLHGVKIQNRYDNYADFGILSFEDFKRLEIAGPEIKKIKENMRDKYIKIASDAENPYKVEGVSYTADIDARSRIIDSEAIIKELKKLEQILPQKLTDRVKKVLIEELLDKAYGTKATVKGNNSFEREKNVQSAYDSIIKSLINGQSDIRGGMGVLNEARKMIIENNRSSAGISFENEEARKKYESSQTMRKISESYMQQRKADEILRYFPTEKYCKVEGEIASVKKETYGLKGIYLVGTVRDDRQRRINIDKLADEMPEITKGIRNKKALDYLQRGVIRKIVSRSFLLNQKKLSKNSELNEIYENVCNSIYNGVIEGKPIDMEKLEKQQEILNDERRQNQKYGSGMLIGFSDNSSKLVYEQLNKLSRMLTEHDFNSVAEGIITAHNLMYKKGEKNAEIEQR